MQGYTNKTRDSVQNLILFFTDSFCIVFSYYLAGVIWMKYVKHMNAHAIITQTHQALVSVLFATIICSLFISVRPDFVTRGRFQEIKSITQKALIFAALIAIYELISKNPTISRGVYVATTFASMILMYITRFLVKCYLIARSRSASRASRVIVVTMKDRAEAVLAQINKDEDWVRTIAGLIIYDEDVIGEEFGGINVVGNAHTMMRYIKNEVVDEVFIDLNDTLRVQMVPMVMELEDMGVTVHIRLSVLDEFKDFDTSLGSLGTIPVVTFANKIFDHKALMIKRFFDILGGLVGFLFLVIFTIIFGPLIKLESKGPVFFKQKRVGKNGRYFYIYKFRSMYIDAEERKKELMAKNEMSGLMFKMENDPRITKIGKFIRKTSIDEFPQFINVLKGDMSLIGTRPPTVNEFMQYEGHHKRRLSMKPGITGMWQAYGRNTVTDFEDVVKMDLDYIDHWSVALDVKILIKTVITIFTKGGK